MNIGKRLFRLFRLMDYVCSGNYDSAKYNEIKNIADKVLKDISHMTDDLEVYKEYYTSLLQLNNNTLNPGILTYFYANEKSIIDKLNTMSLDAQKIVDSNLNSYII